MGDGRRCNERAIGDRLNLPKSVVLEVGVSVDAVIIKGETVEPQAGRGARIAVCRRTLQLARPLRFSCNLTEGRLVGERLPVASRRHKDASLLCSQIFASEGRVNVSYEIVPQMSGKTVDEVMDKMEHLDPQEAFPER